MRALDYLDAIGRDLLLDHVDFGIGVGGEAVDGDNRRHAELFDIGNVAAQIGQTFGNRAGVLYRQIFARHAAMEFQCPHRCDDHCGSGLKTGLAAFDIEKFLGAEVGAGQICPAQVGVSQLSINQNGIDQGGLD